MDGSGRVESWLLMLVASQTSELAARCKQPGAAPRFRELGDIVCDRSERKIFGCPPGGTADG